MKNTFKKIGAIFHRLYDRIYTYWKVKELNIDFDDPLSYGERLFFLKYRSALTGNNLTVFDVGAASGVLSRCVAKLPNVNTVHAFEPIKSAFDDLLEHSRLYPKIKCHNIALGNRKFETDMLVTSDWRDSSSLLKMEKMHMEELPYASYKDNPEKIQVVRLDDIVRENDLPFPDVVKIDVQGYEDRVLEGGSKTLRHATFVILEMSFVSLYKDSLLFDDIYKKMKELNFQLIGMDGVLRGITGRYLQVDGIFQNFGCDRKYE